MWKLFVLAALGTTVWASSPTEPTASLQTEKPTTALPENPFEPNAQPDKSKQPEKSKFFGYSYPSPYSTTRPSCRSCSQPSISYGWPYWPLVPWTTSGGCSRCSQKRRGNNNGNNGWTRCGSGNCGNGNNNGNNNCGNSNCGGNNCNNGNCSGGSCGYNNGGNGNGNGNNGNGGNGSNGGDNGNRGDGNGGYGNNGGPNSRPPVSSPRIPNFKLHYFDFRFRGEPARLILNYKKVPFDDNRIQGADWPVLKSQYPNGQVPVLDIDGKPLPSSFAIYHYLGKLFDLAGADNLDNGKIEYFGEEFRELQQKITPYLNMLVGADAQTTAEAKEKELLTVVRPAINLHCPRLEKALEDSTSNFFGSELSWLDFVVADFTKTLRDGDTAQYMGPFKQMRVHMGKVYELPGVKEYIAKRKDTPV